MIVLVLMFSFPFIHSVQCPSSRRTLSSASSSSLWRSSRTYATLSVFRVYWHWSTAYLPITSITTSCCPAGWISGSARTTGIVSFSIFYLLQLISFSHVAYEPERTEMHNLLYCFLIYIFIYVYLQWWDGPQCALGLCVANSLGQSPQTLSRRRRKW